MRLFSASTMIIAVSFAALACNTPVLAAAAYKTSWTSVVSYVVDGDTVRVRPPDGGKPVSIRVDGIDAPEICQAVGTTARDFLKRQVLGKRVVVQAKVHDIYGRLVGRILLNRQDQGALLVEQGLAWSYRYRGDPGPYAAEQSRAQAQRLGMFSRVIKSAPVYPAVFRKKHGSCYARYR